MRSGEGRGERRGEVGGEEGMGSVPYRRRMSCRRKGHIPSRSCRTLPS